MTLYEDILYLLVSFLGMIWLVWIFLRYVSLDVKENNVAKKIWQQDIDNYQEQKRQIKPRIVSWDGKISATSTITTPKEIEKIKRCPWCRRIGYECSDCGEIVCSWHMCSCEEECDDC